MFDHKHYVPILGAKLGEFRALKDLTPKRKEKLTPLLEITPVGWDFENDEYASTMEHHLRNTAKNIADHWGASPIFADFYPVADDGVTTTGIHPVTFVMDDARGRSLRLIPVTGLDRDAAYQAAVKHAVSLDQRGVCLRVHLNEVVGDPVAVSASLDALLKSFSLTRAMADLVIDLSAMDSNLSATYQLAITTIIAALPGLSQWRTFTVTGSAFPDDMSNVARNSITQLPRTEWRVWSAMVPVRTKLQRMPTFGDHAIDSPGHELLDFRFIKISANIRYCHTLDWYIFRGQIIKPKAPSQFPGLAAQVVAHAAYSGPGFCTGDQMIEDCATGTGGVGSLTTWRQIGVNHHLSFVVDQIAICPGL